MARSVPRRRMETQPRQQYDRWRGAASERGYDWEWSKPGGVADQCKERDEWLCQKCLNEGGLAQAMETLAFAGKGGIVADHRIPAHVRPDLILDVDNTQCLCRRHNAAKAVEDNRRFGGPNAPIESLTASQKLARQQVGAA